MSKTMSTALRPRQLIIIGIFAAVVALLGATGAAIATPAISGTELAQLARANCDKLAANAHGLQKDRAEQCKEDQDKILAEIEGPLPSPTASPTNCLVHPGKCGYPDADTTGPEKGETLYAYTGPEEITTNNLTISNVEGGCLVINATNVTITNSVFRCDKPDWAIAVIGSAESSGTTTISHVRVICTADGGTGIGSTRLAVSYVDMSGCENGFDSVGSTSVTYSYIHDLFLGNETVVEPHPDGMQVWPGSTGIVFSHNTVLMHEANAAFTSGFPEGSPLVYGSFDIQYNLMDGGNYTVYCSNNHGTLSHNRYGALPGWNAGHTAIIPPYDHKTDCGNMTSTGELNDVTGTAL